MKTCTKCDVEKDESEFSKDKSRKDGLYPRCTECRAKYRESNRDRTSRYNSEYHSNHREQILTRKTEYYSANREMLSKRNVEYNKTNRKQRAEYKKTRCQKDPLYALTFRLRSLTRYAFLSVSAKKTSHTFQLLGCTGAELFAVWGIEAIPEGYHIDHVVPIAQAKNVREAEALCHYSNLQLLTAEENMRKHDNRTPEGEALCLTLLGREWKD